MSTGINKSGSVLMAELERLNHNLAVNPDDSDALIRKGAILYTLSRYDEAIMCYDVAIQVNPKNSNAWIGKSECLWLLEKYDLALECVNNVTIQDSLGGVSIKALMLKGDLLIKLIRFQDALEIYNIIINLESTNAFA
jgi:tetratricopeptide (TPR) repeat protein